MKKNFKIMLLALLAAATVFTGCAKKQPDFKDTVAVDKNVTENVDQEQEITPEAPDTEIVPDIEVPAEPEFVNSLSGLECTEEVFNNRPIAVMLNNIKQAMPQIGISKADIVYEVLEEGGITRLMGVFKDYKDIQELGSIRSSRDYYIDLSDAHDAIYVHCGGSTYAKAMLANRKTENIDGLYVSDFYRSKERAKTMVYEHTLMISGEGLTNAISDKGYRTTSDASQPLVFSKDAQITSGTDAQYISVPFSLALDDTPYAHSYFEYDAQNSTYLKNHYNTKHIDGQTNEQLSFKNVITLECDQNIIPGDVYNCLEVHFYGEGTGFYACDGKIMPIVWKKASRTENYTLYEADGTTQLLLKPGKTYIGIVPTGTNITATSEN